MLTGAKLKIIVRGVKIKVQRGEDLEEILESYRCVYLYHSDGWRCIRCRCSVVSESGTA